MMLADAAAASVLRRLRLLVVTIDNSRAVVACNIFIHYSTIALSSDIAHTLFVVVLPLASLLLERMLERWSCPHSNGWRAHLLGSSR